jgi:hypothetical protein
VWWLEVGACAQELLLFASRSALGLLLLPLQRPVSAVLLLVLLLQRAVPAVLVLLLQQLWQPCACGLCCVCQHMARLQALVLQS